MNRVSYCRLCASGLTRSILALTLRHWCSGAQESDCYCNIEHYVTATLTVTHMQAVGWRADPSQRKDVQTCLHLYGMRHPAWIIWRFLMLSRWAAGLQYLTAWSIRHVWAQIKECCSDGWFAGMFSSGGQPQEAVSSRSCLSLYHIPPVGQTASSGVLAALPLQNGRGRCVHLWEPQGCREFLGLSQIWALVQSWSQSSPGLMVRFSLWEQFWVCPNQV